MPFIPTTKEEVSQRGWSELDVIFVNGDAYIDHPAFGVPLLARWLEKHGFRVGIIAQPDWRSTEDFKKLGRPRLFFAAAAGAMDSMVAHYTPARKLRRDDAYTPGNRHGARPNRATLVYASRLKEAYRDVPVVVGGIEASLRRFAHYDFWEDKVRRSLLFDAKSDLLIYGMAERPLLEIALRAKRGEHAPDIRDVRGVCRIEKNIDGLDAALEIPSFEEVSSDKMKFAEAFRMAELEQNPFCGRTIAQRHGDRFLVCAPPSPPLSEAEMDDIYALPFKKSPHFSYKEPIPAWEQIKNSITTHRGCFGGCSFCAINMHQGKIIQSRSEQSILDEITALTCNSWFRGSVSDVGGPTANMYGLSCGSASAMESCRRESCLYPQICKNLLVDEKRMVGLLRKTRKISGVKHVAVASGVRHDLMEHQPVYFSELLAHHVGGLLKVAPEHLTDKVTKIMRKPSGKLFERFLQRFFNESARLGKRQRIVPYLISGHPGCSLSDMLDLAAKLKKMGLKVEQVQDFTPTPGTLSTCMFYTGINPYDKTPVYIPRTDKEKGLQKTLLLWHIPNEHEKAMRAMKELERKKAISLSQPALKRDETKKKKKQRGYIESDEGSNDSRQK